ncbi:MAG: hypothetical protein KR126chlam3_01619 [Chlamydiae bacterium]|nr:hypothetical protein [Chlamydiota bacterium]
MKIKIKKSSGNVFADLGMKNAQTLVVKAELAHQISALIKKKRLTQAKAARILDIDQAKISALINGKISGFTIDRLLRFLMALDQEIEIKVIPRRIVSPKQNIKSIR